MNFPELDELSPILFDIKYIPHVWGGTRLQSVFHREIDTTNGPVGEAIEICDREEYSSTIAEGPFKGITLHQLISAFGKDFVGHSFEGDRFPLIVKLLDTAKRLPLQVSPDEAACGRIGGGAEPKTKMFYIVAAEHDAKVIAGLSPRTSRVRFLETIATKDIEKHLQIFDSIPGDAYFINAGRAHSVGAGNLILEIEQNSITNYRITNWGRVGKDGQPEELHLAQALESIDFTDRTLARVSASSDSVDHSRKYQLLKYCTFFHVDELKLVEEWYDNTENTGSFHLLTAIDHPFRVGRDSLTAEVPAGRTVLIPACFGAYTITPETGTTSTIIRTSL